METFASYSTTAEVRQQHFEGVKWTTLSYEEFPTGSQRPAFTILTVEIPAHTHLNQTGELRLRFVNDRLATTWFYPQDPTGYFAALVDKGVDLRPGEELLLEPSTPVWSARDYQGRSLVGWSDTRLQREERRWRMKYD
jgi:hypothetical protein